jgi:hypothetical protein
MTETFAEKVARWNAERAARPPEAIPPDQLCRHGLDWQLCDICYAEQNCDDVGGWSWLCEHGREGCPECEHIPPRLERSE